VLNCKRYDNREVAIAVWSHSASQLTLWCSAELEGHWVSFQGVMHPESCGGRFVCNVRVGDDRREMEFGLGEDDEE
jgi:hypothetical protein